MFLAQRRPATISSHSDSLASKLLLSLVLACLAACGAPADSKTAQNSKLGKQSVGSSLNSNSDSNSNLSTSTNRGAGASSSWSATNQTKTNIGEPTHTDASVRIEASAGIAAGLRSDAQSGDRVDGDEFQESHRRMLATLQEVDKVAQESHPFLGLRPLRLAEQALQASSPDMPAWDRSVLHGLYGQELLRAGRTSEAIEQMKLSMALVEQLSTRVPSDVRQQIYYLFAVAYLRDAETVNCVHCINGERCLFPVLGKGIHQDKASSRGAIEYLEKALQLRPEDAKARWLLNIAYMTLGEYPDSVPDKFVIAPDVLTSAKSPVGEFRNIAKQTNLNIQGCAGGVIVDDFDGDLDLDVIFSSWKTDASLKYFVNQGDGTFRDASEEANLTGIFGGLNLVQADYDNDGDLDVLVLRGAWLESHGRHPKSLLRNDGHGRFLDVTYAVGLGNLFYPTQTAAWNDFDHDGDLDLYVGNEGFPCQLFENDGRGHFNDIANRAGVVNGGPTKGIAWGDYDNDGWSDIYVSNLGGKNLMYRNLHDGTFQDVAEAIGVEGPKMSFPIWFWDANNDGLLDLYVASYVPGIEHVMGDYLGETAKTEHDAFYFGTGEGRFEDRREQLGFSRVTQPMGVNVGDIDNDGHLDLYLGTGYVDYEGLIPNLLFHNVEGRQLVDITFSSRVGHLQKGHGVAFADFDNDGDQDIFAVMGGWFAGDSFARALFANPGTDAHWLYVRLKGVTSDRYCIGARITAKFTEANGKQRQVVRWVDSGGSFGANPLRVHLGLGDCSNVDQLEVYFPTTGQTQVFSNIAADRFIEVTEGKQDFAVLPFPKIPTLLTEADE